LGFPGSSPEWWSPRGGGSRLQSEHRGSATTTHLDETPDLQQSHGSLSSRSRDAEVDAELLPCRELGARRPLAGGDPIA